MNTKAAQGNYYNRSRICFNLGHLRISKRNSKWLEWFTSTSNWPVESRGSMDVSLLGPSLFLAGRLLHVLALGIVIIIIIMCV